ncbi:LOW QUALITY PROTEIN: hypothetical protein V2J09_023733 [Rumex salicifolius]
MSSDSEDEDELLQIALKEQAERDLNYRRPSASSRPSKPVANYVQPPPSNHNRAPAPAAASRNPNARGSSMPAAKSRNNKSVDEDADSDVELLSISSGDEDSSKASNAGRGRARPGGRKDDEDNDRSGQEPDSWKRVDEAELARRVREMREAKTTPVTQVIEKKPSALGDKGLNSLQSFARGTECIDPLGLGIIDNKSLRLITDSLESSTGHSDRDKVDDKLREKLAYFSDKFDAKLFLSRIHQDTAAADLEAGALSLNTDLKGRTLQRKNLVKENFDCFVSCKTTIDDIESKLRRIEEDPEGAGTAHLFKRIQEVTTLASRAFEPLFERQAQAEKIRSVQGMLQRFRTLFNLPSTIRSSITKGEYDFVVREYRKAKSIVLPSHVGILKRVLEEVEKVMYEFKGTLYKSLEDPQIGLTELENTVRLLLELEPESDPVWHYLNIQNQRIQNLFEKCTSDHETRMEILRNKHEIALSDVRWTGMLQSSDQYPDENGHTHPFIDSAGYEVDSLRGKYICRLTAILIQHFPSFWKVALSVFSGKFAKVTADSNVKTSLSKIEEKLGEGKYSNHSIDEAAGMMHSTISLYEDKVLHTFQDFEESNILRPYMSDAIKDISRACKSLEAKESAPPLAVTALRVLHSEVSKTYILRLCAWLRTSTEEISNNETWVPVSVIERNKSPYTISFLPLAFRSVIISTLDQVNLMLQTLKSEVKTEEMFIQYQEIQDSIRIAFLNCFLDLSGHLERIGNELAQNKASNGIPNGYSYESHDLLPGSVVDSHQKLLIVLSYCKEELSNELHNKYKGLWAQSRSRDEEDHDVTDLANLIRTAAMSYLLDTGIHWGAAPPVKGVRDAAVDLLHTLVAVHAEVFACAKPLLNKTLGTLVEGLVDTLLSLFDENQDKDLRLLDPNGFCQLMIELEYFETVLSPYFTDGASESLKSLQSMLLDKAIESVTDSVENQGHNRRPTRGGEELLEERQQGMSMSPDDLIALAQQCSSELLQAELMRTRLNTACFAEAVPLDSVAPRSKVSALSSFKSPLDSPSKNYTRNQGLNSPSMARHRRR